MIKIHTNIIDIDHWQAGIIDLLGFDDTLATKEPLPVDIEDDYVSFDMYLIEYYTEPMLSPYLAVRGVLSEVKSLYEARGYTASFELEPATDNTYIAVFAYHI